MAVTGGQWFRFLRNEPALDEVNFLSLGGRTINARHGVPFLFKLKARENAIGGGGFISLVQRMPIRDAREFFDRENGAVFRTVTENHGIAIDGDADVTEVFKAVRDVLVVVPPGIADLGKAKAILKRLLGNLSGLSGTIAELRNAYGSGHGRADGFVGLDEKHARLAVMTAGAIAAFVLECDKKGELLT